MSDPEDWASRCPDHLDELSLCPACGGLLTTSLNRLSGVTDVRLDGPGGLRYRGEAVVYVGPVAQPCTRQEVAGRG
ncbi:hypothetical protein [Streptomyces fuscigenes]|uniref:hypothetical protein n=1 Tax=Streptomyces fuscigenes TaxID=1528880 RepID=UPI001F274092|nr:hypothetical protein [Streptomyces fuscigenes]MCF3960268.1 hypothetical protein [Streptomyces fuscigenes]